MNPSIKLSYSGRSRLIWVMLMICCSHFAFAQDSTATEAPVKKLKPVKETFESTVLIDNQTVMVPIKGTFEMDFQHRFGVVKNGYEDFFGLFASTNIRLGASYSPIDKLYVGLGLDKYKMMWDGSVKYSLLQQMTGGDEKMSLKNSPVSVTYYGNMAIDTRNSSFFVHFSDRLTYFHQVMIARKFSDKFSAQIAPSLSHTNAVNGYYSAPGKVSPVRNHNHFAIATMGRYKLSETLALIANYDQPLTKHKSGNPHPNIAAGLQVTTSAHSFQFFMGNYYYLNPQENNMYNQNDYTKGDFLIGFNITRLWNY